MRYATVVVFWLTMHALNGEVIAADKTAGKDLQIAFYEQLDSYDKQAAGLLSFAPSGRLPPEVSGGKRGEENASSGLQNLSLWGRSKFDTSIGLSQRTGSLSWSIASDLSGKRAPNILSELSYEGLEIRGLELKSTLYFFGGLMDGSFLDLRLHRGVITGGETRDSDYDGDNRTQEYSRSLSENTGDFVSDYSFAYGLNVLNKQAISVAVLAGYSFHQQYVRKKNAVKISPDSELVVGNPITGLNSTYQSQWQGPWIGANFSLPGEKHHLALQGELHSAFYYAEADWNLRNSFMHPKSFEHNATGLGWVVDLSYSYTFDFSLRNETTLGISYRAEQWAAKDGVDTLYLASGEVVSTKLNEVAWGGNAVSVQIKILR
ncbi:MAG: hypothetical protein JKY01_07055 [Pseudomonadales bacterium]|nr:hypothetical protein [Pseudomonadales bacterium]